MKRNVLYIWYLCESLAALDLKVWSHALHMSSSSLLWTSLLCFRSRNIAVSCGDEAEKWGGIYKSKNVKLARVVLTCAGFQIQWTLHSGEEEFASKIGTGLNINIYYFLKIRNRNELTVEVFIALHTVHITLVAMYFRPEGSLVNKSWEKTYLEPRYENIIPEMILCFGNPEAGEGSGVNWRTRWGGDW